MICKRFKKFETCPSVRNTICGKPVSLVQILFDDNLDLWQHDLVFSISAQQVVNLITLWSYVNPCLGFVVCNRVQNLK